MGPELPSVTKGCLMGRAGGGSLLGICFLFYFCLPFPLALFIVLLSNEKKSRARQRGAGPPGMASPPLPRRGRARRGQRGVAGCGYRLQNGEGTGPAVGTRLGKHRLVRWDTGVCKAPFVVGPLHTHSPSVSPHAAARRCWGFARPPEPPTRVSSWEGKSFRVYERGCSNGTGGQCRGHPDTRVRV